MSHPNLFLTSSAIKHHLLRQFEIAILVTLKERRCLVFTKVSRSVYMKKYPKVGSHLLFTTVYVPPKFVPYLESYAYITLITIVNPIILVTLKEHCDDEGDGQKDGEDSVFLIRDPFIGWEIWIIVNLLDTVSIIKILVTQTDK